MNKNTVPPFRGLSQKHTDSLIASTVTEAVAAQRGYKTINDANDPALQGFASTTAAVFLPCIVRSDGLTCLMCHKSGLTRLALKRTSPEKLSNMKPHLGQRSTLIVHPVAGPT